MHNSPSLRNEISHAESSRLDPSDEAKNPFRAWLHTKSVQEMLRRFVSPTSRSAARRRRVHIFEKEVGLLTYLLTEPTKGFVAPYDYCENDVEH